MSVEIRYFARLRDELGLGNETLIPAPNCTDVAGLISQLSERGPQWHMLLNDPSVMVAVNKAQVGRQAPIKPGDEVAFLPPVTGG